MSEQVPMATPALIINHFKDGLSVRQIATFVKGSHSTVYDTLNYLKQEKL